MTATTGVRENAANLAKELRKAGVKVTPYQRNPLYGTPNTTFSLAIDRDIVRVWAGTAKVRVIAARDTVAEKGLKQAVLQVFELARKIEHTSRLSYREWSQITDLKSTRHMSQWDLRRKINVSMPESTRYSVVALNRKAVDTEKLGGDYSTDYGTITVRGTVRGTHQNFLVGKDEKSQFVCALPRKATSVSDAHRALRPAGVPSTALRQGEWFFLPATAAEKRAITKAVEARGMRPRVRDRGGRYNRTYEVGSLEEGSSHRAPCQITVGNKLYVTGVVYDSRPGHHGSITLPDWHRVIRNRELVNVTAAGGSGARWD